MINNVVITGRIVKKPEIRHTQSGIATCNFAIAVNDNFTNNKGERHVSFINCVAWRAQAENLAKFMSKGSLIGVVGRIQTDSWDGQDGKRQYSTRVVAENIQFLETRKSTEQRNQGGYGGAPAYGGSSNQNNDPFSGDSHPIEVHADDLPF